MGQIADDIAAGITCSICGQFFDGGDDGGLYEHGYPVVCWDDWRVLSKEERTHHQRAKVKTF